MRKSRKLALIILSLAAISLAFAIGYSWRRAIPPLSASVPKQFDAVQVARGERIAELGDCMYCHTAKPDELFAGGMPLNTPFGVIYSTNLTPDPDSGIGRWPLEAFRRALREGVSRDGHLLYPAFPYPHFTKMSDGDIAALYAYLMSVEPVSAPAHPNDLIFPLNFRPLVAGWNLPFLKRGELPPQHEPESAVWLRGRYLVEGAGHCASCHTPMNAFGAEKSSEAFAGNVIDGWNAPPLNALTHAPKPWTRAQLVDYLRTGLASEHGAAAGPMLPVTQHLGSAPQSDVEAIATYLMSLQPPPSGGQPVLALQPDLATAVDADNAPTIRTGETLFASSCVGCHANGAPMREIGGRPALGLSSVFTSDDPRNAIHLVLQGIPWNGSGTAHYMPPFADVLSDEQIADILAYVRTRYAQRPAWKDVSRTTATIRKEISQP
ncbi:mono/diheme cytochrome c family protein [Caballeronia udeis]|uniref:Mono/diheme cytochrome c family protein n=1 Tax=Caballeronia udeis TaxID=1232866 RepID=A0ABW8N1N7_9BURK